MDRITCHLIARPQYKWQSQWAIIYLIRNACNTIKYITGVRSILPCYTSPPLKGSYRICSSFVIGPWLCWNGVTLVYNASRYCGERLCQPGARKAKLSIFLWQTGKLPLLNTNTLYLILQKLVIFASKPKKSGIFLYSYFLCCFFFSVDNGSTFQRLHNQSIHYTSISWLKCWDNRRPSNQSTCVNCLSLKWICANYPTNKTQVNKQTNKHIKQRDVLLTRQFTVVLPGKCVFYSYKGNFSLTRFKLLLTFPHNLLARGSKFRTNL